ncbi:MAG: alpha/beta fold hydrolase [Gammaproteobacteria bacterium]|nr:alpha/beta fold hydrolase [Gammaproteobacteria bacterium]
MSRSQAEQKNQTDEKATAAINAISDALSGQSLIGADSASSLDHEFKAALSRAFNGMSPIEIVLSYLDWLSHLAISPGRQLQLAQSLVSKCVQLGFYNIAALLRRPVQGPASKLERRVSGENWQRWPFNVLAQAHQTAKDWWDEAGSDVAGVSNSHQELARFITGQVLDLWSPANFPLTNPDVHQATRDQKGLNLARGLKHLAGDTLRKVTRQPPPLSRDFKVGRDVAVTPGKVVFRNELMELIQYSPATEKVGAEPVLFVPAWIMKFYILDLSPHNSMVRYLVEQGKTVFMISWKNPKEKDRDTGFEDYLSKGLFAALDAIGKIVPGRKVNTVGYCIGGTLLLVGAATMARDDDDRLNSVSIFAAQGDFSEAGEVRRFISDSQLEFVDKYMWKKGLLSSENMGGTFGALRVSDLIYGSMVNRYLMGVDQAPNDLMAWNADGTRMPYRMHTDYLHQLFLRNELARNQFVVGDRPVSLMDIRVPIFALGTETDHVAPWRSVYKLHGLTHADLTFLLTSGGHNAGVISGPVHAYRRFRMHTRKTGDKFVDPDSWLEEVAVSKGSWWPAWDEWLDRRMSSKVKPPGMGAARKGLKPITEAPGTYVFQQ